MHRKRDPATQVLEPLNTACSMHHDTAWAFLNGCQQCDDGDPLRQRLTSPVNLINSGSSRSPASRGYSNGTDISWVIFPGRGLRITMRWPRNTDSLTLWVMNKPRPTLFHPDPQQLLIQAVARQVVKRTKGFVEQQGFRLGEQSPQQRHPRPLRRN